MINLYRKLKKALPSQTGLETANAGDLDDHLGGWRRGDHGEIFPGMAIGDDDVVIDFGCGSGANGAFCVARGAYAYLVDNDAARVADAKWRLRETPSDKYEVILSDGNPLPLRNGLASKIIASEVLEHVDDPGPVLVELVRVGQVGAQYLISVPDAHCERLVKQVAHPSAFAKPNHVRIFEREEFANLVRGAGLSIEQHTTTGFYHALRGLLFWADYVDPATNRSDLLDNWDNTWIDLLNTAHGPKIKDLLDRFMPKNQVILARKQA
ncbi:MAG TPA: class I SAM-dependent methyltransferase [Alphaproteobacteria bacterium]|nr:class I SAM-dependent methyltransferase [Alphaproteobacteria bacterium]